MSEARCRSPKCPTAGSAAIAPGSSILRPTARNARSPRRHRQNKSASACSCSQPAAIGYGDKSRSMPVPHCAAGGAPPRCSRDRTVNASWGGVPHSWAWICAVPRHGTRLHSYLRHTLENIACFGGRCSKGSMDDSILPGYPFHDACITNHLALNRGHCHCSSGFGGRYQLEVRKIA